MIGRHLGQTIDIHGGGQDLIFPHHENEIAQGTCAHGQLYCHTWGHNSFVTVDGQKMSKSLGNVLWVRDLLSESPGEVISLALLSTNYHKPLDWNAERLQAAQETLTKFYDGLSRVAEIDDLPQAEPDIEVLEAVRNDLNISGALVRLHALLLDLNNANNNVQRAHAKSVLLASAELMGLLQQSPEQALAELRPESRSFIPSSADLRIKTLIAEREEARQDRDFAKADELREELEAEGFVIEDTCEGPLLRPVVKGSA